MGCGFFCAAILGALSLSARAQESGLAHGLWVWKGPAVAQAAQGPEKLRDFCRSQGINEVYLALAAAGETIPPDRLSNLIGVLHASKIRVEALLSSEDADSPGQSGDQIAEHRNQLLDQVRATIAFNQTHSGTVFDGIHLGSEERPAKKDARESHASGLRSLPALIEMYAAVHSLAGPAGLTVNADIEEGLLHADLDQRKALMTSLPRFILLLDDLSRPHDSAAAMADKLQAASDHALDVAYDGLIAPNLATFIIGLRASDYGVHMSAMLHLLDFANRLDPRYEGWAWNAYGDNPHGR